ncbi:MAG: ligase [Ramlibacter sp.]|nr:ligase [Ramlibacter sp.]
MRNNAFQPCLPSRGTKVPTGPDWINEVKHDGYRLIVQRDGKRVRQARPAIHPQRPRLDRPVSLDRQSPLKEPDQFVRGRWRSRASGTGLFPVVVA